MAQSPAEKQQAYRQRQKAKKVKEFRIMAPLEDHPKLSAYAAKLAKARIK